MARAGSLGVSYSVRWPDKSEMLAAQAGCFRRGGYAVGGRHRADRAGLRGMSLWASDSSCWRAGVAPARAARWPGLRAGRPAGPPGVSREADATAVTLSEFPPGGHGRVLRAERRIFMRVWGLPLDGGLRADRAVRRGVWRRH